MPSIEKLLSPPVTLKSLSLGNREVELMVVSSVGNVEWSDLKLCEHKELTLTEL